MTTPTQPPPDVVDAIFTHVAYGLWFGKCPGCQRKMILTIKRKPESKDAYCRKCHTTFTFGLAVPASQRSKK